MFLCAGGIEGVARSRLISSTPISRFMPAMAPTQFLPSSQNMTARCCSRPRTLPSCSGVYRHPSLTAIRQARLEVLLRGLPVLPFDASAAVAYRRIIAQCGWARRRDYDRITAAHAISSRSIFVTNNLADFSDIPGLSIENWVA